MSSTPPAVTSQKLDKAGLPEAISTSLSKLQGGAVKWNSLPDIERASVARQCRAQLATLDLTWAEDNLRCLGINPSKRDADNTLGFDPLLFLFGVVDRLDKIADHLEGKPSPCGKEPARRLPNLTEIWSMGNVGQSAPDCSLELWCEVNLAAQDKPTPQGVCIVLGAGNQNFLTAFDVIDMAFERKQCVFLKQHPLRPFMLAPFAHIFAPLERAGAFAQCNDADIMGAHSALVSHELVSHVHMTGSGATHDKVVAALRAANCTDTTFTSELGNVTPWIVCPGTQNNGVWTQEQIEHHVHMLIGAFKSSCSMNCLSPKVLVLPETSIWPQREEFLATFRRILATTALPPPYYPGAHRRWTEFSRAYGGNVEKIDMPSIQKEGEGLTEPMFPELGQSLEPLPAMLVKVGALGSQACTPYAVENEAFAPVLAIADVVCDSAKDFPLAAARAVNNHVFGTLTCNLIYPDDQDEQLDAVLSELKYGCISVNYASMLTVGNAYSVWGAYPGAYSEDKPGSGLAFVGNAAHVPGVCKSVGKGPFHNKRVALDKPLPLAVSDSLAVLVAGKRFGLLRVIGYLFSRGFGIIPRRLPADPNANDRRGRKCFEPGARRNTQ